MPFFNECKAIIDIKDWGEPVYTVQRDSMYTRYNSSVDRAIWVKFWIWVEHYNAHVSV